MHQFQPSTVPEASNGKGQSLLEVDSVTKSFSGSPVLRKVSIRVAAGEVVGLVGENGAGKSTLLRLIAGAEPADGGGFNHAGRRGWYRSLSQANEHGVGLVFQEQNLVPNLAVADNLFLAKELASAGILRQREMRRDARQILTELGLAEELAGMRVSTLSLGRRQVIEIVRAIHRSRATRPERRLLLLDEPTEALSFSEIQWLFELVRNERTQGCGIVFVSHRLEEVLEVCERVYVLKDGEMVGEHLVDQRLNEGQLHFLMTGRERDADFYAEQRQRHTFGRPVLRVDALGLSDVFEDVSFEVREGEILGIAGVQGSGRSDVLRVLAGDRRPDRGGLELNGAVVRWRDPRDAIQRGVVLVPSERKAEGVVLAHKVRWNLSLPRIGTTGRFVNPFAERRNATTWVRNLGVRPADPERSCEELSGGNQQKVAIGKWLQGIPLKVLLADEPTRGIDVGAKADLYRTFRQLADDGVAIVVSSDSLLELIGVSNRILVMRDGRVQTVIDAPAQQKPAEIDIVRHMV